MALPVGGRVAEKWYPRALRYPGTMEDGRGGVVLRQGPDPK